MPKISIIITAYNYGLYIEDAIKSALEQSIPSHEIIVVDDGSTDNTKEIVQKYTGMVKYIYQENKGLPEARNTGIKECTGDYILPLDADDRISPYYIEDIVKALEDDPSIDVVYCDLQHYGDRIDRVYMNFPLNKETFKNCNPISYCSAVRKSLAHYNPQMKFGWEDYEQWIRLFLEGRKFKHISIAHFFYHRHGYSMINTSYKPEAVEYSNGILKYLHPELYV